MVLLEIRCEQDSSTQRSRLLLLRVGILMHMKDKEDQKVKSPFTCCEEHHLKEAVILGCCHKDLLISHALCSAFVGIYIYIYIELLGTQ